VAAKVPLSKAAKTTSLRVMRGTSGRSEIPDQFLHHMQPYVVYIGVGLKSTLDVAQNR
jgi:hypothetical protein